MWYDVDMERATRKRTVMCKGKWPEDNYADFVVYSDIGDMPEEQAFANAREAYSDDNEFYIVEG